MKRLVLLFATLGTALCGCPEEKKASIAVEHQERSLPERIIILRHGEDIHRDSDEGLTAKGLARADALAAKIPAWPVLGGKSPGAIFATSFHTVQTIKPSALKLGLPLVILHKPKKFKAWLAQGDELRRKKLPTARYFPDAEDVFMSTKGEERTLLLVRELHSPKYRGMTVVVCWVHEEIPSLVRELGYTGVPEWPQGARHRDQVFDQFWVLDFAHDARDQEGRLLFDEKKNISPEQVFPIN